MKRPKNVRCANCCYFLGGAVEVRVAREHRGAGWKVVPPGGGRRSWVSSSALSKGKLIDEASGPYCRCEWEATGERRGECCRHPESIVALGSRFCGEFREAWPK
jgi:hypothetical protein